MAQSLREHNGATFAVDGPDGTSIPLRIDPDSSVRCNTCDSLTVLHIFRPGIDYRCGACVATYGKAPTVTVAGVVTLSTDGRHIGTYRS
jgi:hypothetical protein